MPAFTQRQCPVVKPRPLLILARMLNALLSLSALALLQIPGPTTISGPVTIVDGDTIRLGAVPVRIHGIDAPEAGQACQTPDGATWSCGGEATGHLATLTEGRTVVCEALDRDAYGRVIGRCSADGTDLAAQMVSAGLAWSYRKYSKDYADIEDAARAQGIGVWSSDNQAPWDYRANGWNRAADVSPREGCPIKGNISRKGERIYHTPWSPSYAKTVIDESAGERWFCDEAEAQAAGWRAPKGR